MLTTYFKHPFTLRKLRSGLAGPYLDTSPPTSRKRATVTTRSEHICVVPGDFPLGLRRPD